jgi:hypothetical protein
MSSPPIIITFDNGLITVRGSPARTFGTAQDIYTLNTFGDGSLIYVRSVGILRDYA